LTEPALNPRTRYGVSPITPFIDPDASSTGQMSFGCPPPPPPPPPPNSPGGLGRRKMNADPSVGFERSLAMAGTMQLSPKRTGLMRKMILLVTVLGVLCGGGFWAYHAYFAKAAPPPATNMSYTVASGNIFQAVASTGKVVANKDVEIKCKASGQVIELPFVDVGLTVKKDDLLVQVDPIDL
jgi:hypothetical protein